MKTHKSKAIMHVATAAATVLFANGALAVDLSHNFINSMRSSVNNHILVSQGVEGVYGSLDNGIVSDEQGIDRQMSGARHWRGFGLTSEIGVELMKFVQFNAGHTYHNLRSKSNSLETLSGSTLYGETKLVFAAPIANLELGLGAMASHLDYRFRLDNGEYYGTGYYYTVGVNHFLTSQVSVYSELKTIDQKLERGSGSARIDGFKVDAMAVSAGFSIWL